MPYWRRRIRWRPRACARAGGRADPMAGWRGVRHTAGSGLSRPVEAVGFPGADHKPDKQPFPSRGGPTARPRWRRLRRASRCARRAPSGRAATPYRKWRGLGQEHSDPPALRGGPRARDGEWKQQQERAAGRAAEDGARRRNLHSRASTSGGHRVVQTRLHAQHSPPRGRCPVGGQGASSLRSGTTASGGRDTVSARQSASLKSRNSQ